MQHANSRAAIRGVPLSWTCWSEVYVLGVWAPRNASFWAQLGGAECRRTEMPPNRDAEVKIEVVAKPDGNGEAGSRLHRRACGTCPSAVLPRPNHRPSSTQLWGQMSLCGGLTIATSVAHAICISFAYSKQSAQHEDNACGRGRSRRS
jgi:hypothetical protein